MADEQVTTPTDKAAEPAKTLTAATTPTPTPPVTVPLTLDEYNRLRSVETQFSEFQRAKQAELEAKEAERIKALADKGKVDEALEALNKTHADKLSESTQRYADLERQVFAERKAAVIAQSLAGRQFLSEFAAQQAQVLLEADVEIVRGADGKLIEVDRVTRQPARDTLKAKLDSSAFAHFFAPTTTSGGAGQQGGNVAAQTEEPKPGSLEYIAAQFKAAQAKSQSIGMRRSV